MICLVKIPSIHLHTDRAMQHSLCCIISTTSRLSIPAIVWIYNLHCIESKFAVTFNSKIPVQMPYDWPWPSRWHSSKKAGTLFSSKFLSLGLCVLHNSSTCPLLKSPLLYPYIAHSMSQICKANLWQYFVNHQVRATALYKSKNSGLLETDTDDVGILQCHHCPTNLIAHN